MGCICAWNKTFRDMVKIPKKCRDEVFDGFGPLGKRRTQFPVASDSIDDLPGVVSNSLALSRMSCLRDCSKSWSTSRNSVRLALVSALMM